MRLYTVHVKDPDQSPTWGAPQGSGRASPGQEAPSFELVRDGFCWPALILPVLWGLWRGQWTGMLVYLLCIIGISTLTVIAEPGEAVELALGFALAVLVGFSANDWRRWRLRRMGYRDAGAVAAVDADEAALRVLGALEAGDLNSGTDVPVRQAGSPTASGRPEAALPGGA